MNTKHLIILIALLGLLPALSQAKSPWDKGPATNQPAAETAPASNEMMEPVEPIAIPAEPEMIEPLAAEPMAEPMPEPMPEPMSEPMPESSPAPAPVVTSKAVVNTPPEAIEVIETRGDVLDMPQPEIVQTQSATLSLLEFPRRGMDQEKVQSELGTPVEIQDAVGKPPITRWIYNDRVVYFEYSTVLHVVAR